MLEGNDRLWVQRWLLLGPKSFGSYITVGKMQNCVHDPLEMECSQKTRLSM